VPCPPFFSFPSPSLLCRVCSCGTMLIHYRPSVAGQHAQPGLWQQNTYSN
jgi:hypothetical protein